MRVLRPSILLSAITASALAYVDASLAQIEEVIVTAQKRSESVQEVPIAINALAGDQLDALGIQDTDDLAKVMANVSTQGLSSINSGLTIRGVGTANWHITAQQAVGQYMDEVSLFSPYTSALSLFDMERVEVLRGPQNTLFGRNTTGGAVNYISQKPNLDGELEGYFLTNIGNEGKFDFEGAVSLPLGEKAAFRIAAQSVERDALWENLWDGSAMGDIDRKSARAQLLVTPGDNTEVLANLHVGYDRSGVVPLLSVGFWDPNGGNIDTNGRVINPNAAPDCPSLVVGNSAQFDTANPCLALAPAWVNGPGGTFNPSAGGWHKAYSASPDKGDVDFEGGFIKVTHDYPAMSLTSITSYDELSVEFNQDYGGNLSGQSFKPGQSGTQKVFGQELRLASTTEGPVQWIAGAYYSSEEGDLATIIYRIDPGGAPFGIVPSVTITQEVEIISGYGKFDVDVSDALKLSLGLRYTRDEKSGDSLARVFAKTDTGTVPALGGVPVPVNEYWSLDHINSLPENLVSKNTPVTQVLNEWAGDLRASYFFGDGLMAYASYARGFKSGAFDTRALAALQENPTADQPTKPEFLDAFELGFKSTLVDGLVEFNGALFFYQWQDMQAFGVDLSGSPAYVNLPETELKGFELEAKWTPTDTLYLQAGMGYNDSELTDVGIQSAVEGAPMQGAPKWSVTGLITKSFLFARNELVLQSDFKWRDEFYSGLSGESSKVTEAVTLLNARVSYLFGDEQQYEVAAWAENITGEKYCLRLEDQGTLNYMLQCLPNAGMAFYGLNARVSF